MAQIINIPGEGQVSFPDGMSNTDIEAAIHANYPKLRTAPDKVDTAVKYSAASGPANFADMIPNAITNVANLGIAGGAVANNELPTFVKQAMKFSPIFGAMTAASDLKKLYDQKVNGASANDLPQLIPNDALSGWGKLGRTLGLIDDKYAPTDIPGKVVDFGTQALTGGGVNPVSVVKNLAKGNAAPVVRDVLAAGISGAGAGLGAGLAENVKTGNESVDNAIKIAASLVGGLAGTPVAMRGTGGDRAAAATKGVTPEQMSLARQFKQDAIAKGLPPMTDYEAIQAITGLNPKMITQQRVAEQSDSAGKQLTHIMQARPHDNAAAFQRVVDKISSPEAFPDTLAGELQQTANSALKSAKEFRTEAASPDYRAQRASDAAAMSMFDKIGALGNNIEAGQKWKNDAIQQAGRWYANSHEMGNKANDIASRQLGFAGDKGVQRFLGKAEEYKGATQDAVKAAADRQAHIDNWRSELNATQDALAAKNLPYIENKVGGFLSQLDNDIRVAGPTNEGKILKAFRDEIAPNDKKVLYPSQLESIYKDNRNKLELGLSPTDLQKTQAGVLKPYVKNLDALIQEVSPAIKQGRQIYAQLSKEYVNPLDASQVGKLARSDDFKQQSNTLFPDAPADVTPSVIKRTADKLNAENPEIMRRFLAQDLRRKFDEANQRNVGGENVFGGAKFASLTAGNPTQEKNLAQAIISSGAEQAPFNDLLKVFRAQGFKSPVNSATAFNQAEAARLATNIADIPHRPWIGIPRIVDKWRNGMATEELAKAIASQNPTGPMAIEELARINGVHDPMKQQMLINLLLSNQATK